MFRQIDTTTHYRFVIKRFTPSDLFYDVVEWCRDRFGEPSMNDDDRWGYGVAGSADTKIGSFFFLEEKDAIEFKLRWV